MNRFLGKIRKRGKRFEGKSGFALYSALALFVAIPLPGTGAWTGAILAWLFGFNRRASFVAISLGVLLAGIIILFISLGLFSLF